MEIIAVSNKAVSEKLLQYRKEMKEQILSKDEKLNKIGYQKYLEETKK
jgi:phosphoribosylcarboxyaminoimidazole (NCAIR) mutase